MGYWCQNVCKARTRKGKYLIHLTPERIKQLDSLNFCWEKLNSEFIRNVNECITFYNEKKRRPSRYSDDENERHLGNFLLNNARAAKKTQFPSWKIKLLYQIPTFQIADDKKMVAIKMIDIENNRSTYFYSSMSQASKALFSKFHVTENANTAYSAIYKHLKKKNEKLLYRERFMFKYATNKEIKKYLEDSKVN